jgi:hypothetical protein
MPIALEDLIALSRPRAVDRLADSMADEILRDPAVRAELIALALAAFDKVWADMRRRGDHS